MSTDAKSNDLWEIKNSACSNEDIKLDFMRKPWLDNKERLFVNCTVGSETDNDRKEIKDILINVMNISGSLEGLREYARQTHESETKQES